MIGKRPCNGVSARLRTWSSREASGAASISPPWFGRRTCKNASAKWRETADGVLTNVGAIAIPKPRRVTPPALGCTHVRASQKSLFHRRANDVHQEQRVSARRGAGIAPGRTIGTHPLTIVARSAKSGGCQPAVVRETHLQRRYRTRSRTLVACESRSGGREPAVGREPHLQERFRKVAGDCRRWPTNVGAITFVKPRGLTSPALVRACECDGAEYAFRRRAVRL